MKRLVSAVTVVILAFSLTAPLGAEVKNNYSEDSSAVSTAKPAKKHTIKKKSLSRKHKKNNKNKNTASMFKKTLFDDPALRPKQ